MPNLKAVLLDVDGTLVDSNDAHAHAWVKALINHGKEVSFAQVRSLIGKGGDKLLPEVAGVAADSSEGKAISAFRKEIFVKAHLPSLQPFPRVQQLLARMKADGLRLAIASSAKDNELNGLLKICGAKEFIEIRTSSDDAANSKPDPDIIRAALTKLGLPAAQVILLGDTPYDVAAGLRAKVSVVAVRCGGWPDKDLAGARAIYDDAGDILDHYDASPFKRA